jgi:hypothetical protein
MSRVKEGKKDLPHQFEHESKLAQVADNLMMEEGRKFWKEKGNLAVNLALEEAKNFTQKAGETWMSILKPSGPTGTGCCI